MKLLRNVVATMLLAIMPLAMTVPASAQTFNNGGKGCSVRELGPFTNAFSVSGKVASTTVQVSGPARCHETVSVASWNAALGSSGFVNQRFHTGRTFTLPTGRHTLSVGIDNSCTYQADVLLGSRLTSASGDARYGPAFLMGYKQARLGACQAAPAPVAPAATVNNVSVNACNGNTTNVNSGIATQGGNCSTNTTTATGNTVEGNTINGNPEVNNAPETPAAEVATASAAQPTQLANTGPGSVVALFALATIGGTLFHRLVLRKNLLR